MNAVTIKKNERLNYSIMETYYISVLNIKNELVNNGHFVIKASNPRSASNKAHKIFKSQGGLFYQIFSKTGRKIGNYLFNN